MRYINLRLLTYLQDPLAAIGGLLLRGGEGKEEKGREGKGEEGTGKERREGRGRGGRKKKGGEGRGKRPP